MSDLSDIWDDSIVSSAVLRRDLVSHLRLLLNAPTNHLRFYE
jgi:hypothetical protein